MIRIVIDANVWIRFARSKNIQPLRSRLIKYQMVPVANNYLLLEIFDALVDNGWMPLEQAQNVVELVTAICLIQTEHAIFRLSIDPEDNYLIDLATQYHCKYIISDDSMLARVPLLPIPVRSSNWFLETLPI
jgi:putative PIN family toxin of toxin-antitoxin system